MVYRVIGLMSGSSLDGLDIAFIEFQESAGNWSYELRYADTFEYPDEWKDRLRNANALSAIDYLLLNAEYGRYIGEQVNRFIEEHDLHYQVQLISSHGHTSFHVPDSRMTAQLGDGATIAAVTGINVVSDLRAMDVALSGQGAPIVPVGEQLLFDNYLFFLNLGGIANISFNDPGNYIAFDVCPANRVLNLLAEREGEAFDDEGKSAAKGSVVESLLNVLNDLEYYSMPYPKSLSNDFGNDVVYPLIRGSHHNYEDCQRTYVEHICDQVLSAVESLQAEFRLRTISRPMGQRMLITGGGAKNTFLIERLTQLLARVNVTVELPSNQVIDFKEAIIMGLIGVLRWREENNTLASVTGASRDSIGGAVWIGQEA